MGKKVKEQEVVEKKSPFDGLPRLICKNKNQEKLAKAIVKNDVIVGYGPAGTGKTYVALSQAFELAKKYPDKYKSIVLIKSVTVVKSEEIGFIPGSAQEKMDPFMYSFTCLIDKLFENKGTAKRLLSAGVIEWLPLAFVRGINIDNSIVILDEVQNISTDLFKTIITRLGKDSKIIFLGDTEQIDMKEKHKSCLAKICDMFKESEFVKIVKFDETDCVRNKIIPQILKIFKQHEI